jgi:hypothetical protein
LEISNYITTCPMKTISLLGLAWSRACNVVVLLGDIMANWKTFKVPTRVFKYQEVQLEALKQLHQEVTKAVTDENSTANVYDKMMELARKTEPQFGFGPERKINSIKQQELGHRDDLKKMLLNIEKQGDQLVSYVERANYELEQSDRKKAEENRRRAEQERLKTKKKT